MCVCVCIYVDYIHTFVKMMAILVIRRYCLSSSAQFVQADCSVAQTFVSEMHCGEFHFNWIFLASDKQQQFRQNVRQRHLHLALRSQAANRL